MKTTIIIDNGRVEIQIDDQAPVVVAAPVVAPHHESKPAAPTLPKKPESGAVQLPAPRKCEICDGPIPQSAHKLSKVCSDKCRDEKRRRYQKQNYSKPEPIKPPTPPVPMNKRTVITSTFEDPWNCEMCRNAQDLCVMHQSMTDDGKTPPGWRP